MNVKRLIVAVSVSVVIGLLIYFVLNLGTEVTDTTPHSCDIPTDLVKIFCKEN